MPGPTSKASLDLAQVRFQIKSGKTRKGRTLEPEEITALEEKRDRMDAEMRAERQKKFIGRITDHTTSEADRVIREVPQAVQQCIAEELDKRFGPAPVGALDEALAERARANKRVRGLRKQQKKDAAMLPGSIAANPEAPSQSTAVTSEGAAEPTEEPPTKRCADAFTLLRKVLVKYQVGGYDVWHVPANDRPICLRFLDEVGQDALMKALGEIPVRHGKDEIVMGEPQFIGGDHVSHGGHFRPKAYDTLLMQHPPLEDGVWTNRYPGTFAKFHASTSNVDRVPFLGRAVYQWNVFLRTVELPPCNIVMNRWYEDGGRHLGWHSDAVEDLHELGLIAVLRGGRRAFQVRDKATQRMIFDRVLEPFDLVIMTAHGSNLETEHCVPKEEGASAAHSLTFRTSVRRETQEELKKHMERAQRSAQRRRRGQKESW